MNTIKNKWLQHCILLSAPLLSVIDVFIVNISIPSIQKDLQATDGQMELVIATYLIGFASFIITGGRIGDYWGRKKTFIAGMTSFIFTSCICGAAGTPDLLIFARFFQGVAAAFMLPQSLAYLQFLFPEHKERTKAIGLVGFTLGTASVLGQFLGGYFSSLHTSIPGWRFIFYINFPIGILALSLAAYYLMEYKTKSVKSGFGIGGVILVVLTLFGWIYPLSEGRDLGWPWWLFAFMVIAVICFVMLLKLQRRRMLAGKFPLIQLDLFKIKSFNRGITAAVFYFMMHTSYLLVSTIYVQKGLQKTPYATGLYFVMFGFSLMLASLLSIRLVHRLGIKAVIVGMLLMLVGYTFQLLFFGNTATDFQLYTTLFVTGFSGGMVMPSLINISLRQVPEHLAGIASGVYNTGQQAASSIGICIVAGIFFYVLKLSGVVSAFHVAVIIEMLLALTVFCILIVIHRKGNSV